MSRIPEINIKLKTKKIKAEVCKDFISVRSLRYNGFFGKVKTIFYWILYHKNKTFKEYLDSPITYCIEEPTDIQYGLHIEKEIIDDLVKELQNKRI